MNQHSVPSVEIVQGPSSGTGLPPHAGGMPPTRKPRRVLVFCAVFILISALGQAWNFSREAIYQTSATVLTVKPKAVDTRSTVADLEHVAIQGRALLSDTVIDATVARINRGLMLGPADPESLRAMLSWSAVPDTNLIELRAEGSEPALLAEAANAWAEAYEAQRQTEIRAAKTNTMDELADEQANLAITIRERQATLSAFRDRHDIVSIDREDNRAPADLKGLNKSLNKARDALSGALGKRRGIDAAIAAGKLVMPDEQRAAYAQRKVEKTRDEQRLAGLQKRFTQAYLDRDPELRELPDRIEAAEAELAAMREVGQREAIERADQAVAEARATVATLEARMSDNNAAARRFESVFSDHQALEAELSRLQELHTANARRLAQIEARNVEQYPPVEIVSTATVPLAPVRPAFKRDALWITGFAALAALFMTWLVEYLNGRNREDELQTMTGIRVYGGDWSGNNGADHPAPLPGQTAAGLEHNPAAVLAAPTGDTQSLPVFELEQAEIHALFHAADERTRGIIALLLSGLAPGEFAALDSAAINSAAGEILVNAETPRTLRLSSAARSCLAGGGTAPAGVSASEIDAALTIAAVDAGFVDPGRARGRHLHYSYAVFLVRQGLRLSELASLLGHIPDAQLQGLGRYSPPGPNQALSAIDPAYPLPL